MELPGGIVAKRKLLNEFYHELTDMQGIGSESNLTASIVAYVEKHYSSDLYLERIAQELGLSVEIHFQGVQGKDRTKPVGLY